QTGRPPGTDGDQRLQRADSKVRCQTDGERNGYRSHATGEEEWNNWHKSADGCGDGSRRRSSPLIWKPMLGQAELALRHRLHKLFRLLSKALSHFLRLFRSESLQLIKERHLFDFFLGIFFDFGALTRDFGFIDLGFTLSGEVCARAHRQCGSKHPRKPGNQNVMLLVIGCAGHARNNSKHRAKPVVCSVNRIGYPTAASPVPPFALQDFVQRSAWTCCWRHRTKRPRM